MLNIKFPQKSQQRYYDSHFVYLLDIFRYLNYKISYYDRDDDKLIVYINDKPYSWDYWDSNQPLIEEGMVNFKFHTEAKDLDKVEPFPPISFYDWRQFYFLRGTIKYNSENKIISNRQRPYGNALVRRTKVQEKLQTLLVPSCLKTSLIPQVEFWNEVNEISLFTHIGGNRQFMIDRAPLQYMGFGACVLSATIPEVLPWHKTFEGCYLKMADDYSDLISIIFDYPMKYQKIAQEIGDRAKKLFDDTCTPSAIGEWIEAHV